MSTFGLENGKLLLQIEKSIDITDLAFFKTDINKTFILTGPCCTYRFIQTSLKIVRIIDWFRIFGTTNFH